MSAWLDEFLANAMSPIAVLGFIGQAVFFLRFLVQWLSSEKHGRSVIPIAFWYLSIGGAGLLLLYGILDHDPVILLGQSMGIAIYLRNLHLIRKAAAAGEES